MRREFVALETAMRKFIEQPDYPTLIINASDNDVLFPTKILQNWERAWNTHIFLLFPFGCDKIGQYLQACMDLLKAQVDAVNTARARDGQDSWPPLPLSCLDPRQPPNLRLEAAVRYVRTIIPEPIGIIWGLMPSKIGDPLGYVGMIAPLLATGGVEDWLEGHRFLLRDDAATPFLLPVLQRQKVESVLVLDIDFSTPRVADALVGAVNDENLPTTDRMQALSQLAAFDLAYQRFGQALEKYDLLHAYHVQQGDPVGQALALGGAADVALRAGGVEMSKARYQQALAVAVLTGNLGLALNLLMGAGEVCLRLKHLAEAEGYFDFASRTAGKLVNPYVKVTAMEKLGVARLEGGKAREAVDTWMAAKDLCRQFDCQESRRSILDRLIALYSRLGMKREARECQLEKDSIDTPA
jgi:hypothetical protein